MVFLGANVVLQVLNLCDTKSQSSCQYYVHCCIPRSVVELDVVGGDISMSFFSFFSLIKLGDYKYINPPKGSHQTICPYINND